MAEPIYQKSVFAKYFTSSDPELVAWADNVLAKLVAKGIVPNYIERDGEGLDTDFEVLYKPITLFFGYLVRLAREFRDFKLNEDLGGQYLTNKGIFVSGDETLDQTLYLISNLLRARAERGTTKMYEKSADADVPHGEMLRLIAWNPARFFKLGVAQPKMNSWNVGNSSPMFRGCTGRYDLNIGYEDTESVKSLLPYPMVNSQYASLSTYLTKECMEITGVPALTVSGIGANVEANRIVVTSELNFEITFYVAQDVPVENITFGCLAFDSAGNPVDLQDIETGLTSNFFFQKKKLNQAGKFYMVRGILYNKDQFLLGASDAKLNIGFGKNLRMPEAVASIIPYIVVDNTVLSNDSVFIWNPKVTPASLVYGRSYLDNKNFIDIVLTNKNAGYSNADVHDIYRKFFIPYNTAFNTTFFDSLVDAIEVGSFLLLESGEFILYESGDKILLEQQ